MHNYVCHRNKLPVVFSTYFEENKVIHKYNTRQKDDFHIDVIKTEIGKRSINYKGSKLWNDLPAELKEISHFNLLNINLRTIYCSLWHVSSSKVLHLHLHLHLVVWLFLSLSLHVSTYIRLKAMFRAAIFGGQFALLGACHLYFLFFVIIFTSFGK